MLDDDRYYSSDSEFVASSSGASPSPRSPSPIYAKPYAYSPIRKGQYGNDYPNVSSSFTYIPCCKTEPQFHAPPPPKVTTFEKDELDFLAELDAQITELQVL